MKSKNQLWLPLFIAAVVVSFIVSYRVSWITGILFICSAVFLAERFVRRKLPYIKKFDSESKSQIIRTIDKELSSNWKGQIVLLATVVGIVFFFLVGLVLILSPKLSQVPSTFVDGEQHTAFQVLLVTAHRFAGLLYTKEATWMNTLLFVISLLGSILFSSMLIATISNIVQQRKLDVERGNIDYKVKDHVVIIGFGDIVVPLCKEVFKTDATPQDKERRIVILTNQNLSFVRSSLRAKLDEKSYNRIILYSGNVEEKRHLKRLDLNECKEVFIIGDQQQGHDAFNLACLKRIGDFLDEIQSQRHNPMVKRVKVYIQLDSYQAFSVMQKLDIPVSYTHNLIDVHTFNIYENQARRLWGYYKEMVKLPYNGEWKYKFKDLDFSAPLTPDSHNRAHLVIVGFNKMGQALLLEALRICHYPNYDTSKIKTKVTIVDKDLDNYLNAFKAQFPHLDEIEDIEIEGISAYAESSLVRGKLLEWVKDENELITIAVCLDDADSCLSTGLGFPEELYFAFDNKQAHNNTHVQILIAQHENSSIDGIIESSYSLSKPSRYRNVKFFGPIEESIAKELLDDKVAMLQNIFFDSKFMKEYSSGEKGPQEILSEAQQRWSSLSENLKYSNRYQVEMYKTYQRYEAAMKEKGLTEEAVNEVLSRMEHRRWCAERRIMGYVPADYKSSSDTFSKSELEKNKNFWRIHLDLRPFDSLNKESQNKADTVHRSLETINSILSAVGNLEKGGSFKIEKNYTPSPLDLSEIELSDDLKELTEILAENTHQLWARARMDEGWTYGPQRDDVKKKHPCLIPYSSLSENEKDYDRATAMNALKLIMKLGYSIKKQ